ncbi:hypothetical protein Xsto_04059 [Xenorhabdus stockiae]|uniref:Uncharacterized protein n=1 Tax=Xenorhabdus stockiae TaxID=351614 RepID=A0A2D0K6S9_9GAMM|nr:hypothetical protein [Xenorhabdus stockiae]PHM59148.1 hypothetical protein Xsto_04059 [Xenorhabdus stockiae]
MSDVIDPKKNPEQAAQQVLIELIRADKVGGVHGVGVKNNTEALLYVYSTVYNHFKKFHNS